MKGCDIFKIIDLTFVWKANKIRDSSKWSQHLNRAHNPLHAVVIILTLYRINLNFKLSVFDFVDHWISIFPLLRSMDCWICVKQSIWKHSFVTTQMIKKILIFRMQSEQYIWPTLISFLHVTRDWTAIWPDKSNKKAIDSCR